MSTQIEWPNQIVTVSLCKPLVRRDTPQRFNSPLTLRAEVSRDLKIGGTGGI